MTSPASSAAVICFSDLTICRGPPSPLMRIESVIRRNQRKTGFLVHPAQATKRTFRGQACQTSSQSMKVT
jgi:hypothetical protein